MFRLSLPTFALAGLLGCNAFVPAEPTPTVAPDPWAGEDPLPAVEGEPPTIHLETSPTAGVYVVDKLGGDVVRFHRSSGRVLDVMGERLDRPTDVVLHQGIFYVAARGPGAGLIHRFDALSHAELAPLVLDGEVVAEPGAILIRGGALVVLGKASENLVVLDLEDGALIAELSEGVVSPHDVALGPDNLLYLSHEGEDGVLVWNPDTGHLVRSFASAEEIETPAGLAFLGHELLIADLTGDQVASFDPVSGELREVFAPAFRPSGLVVTPANQVLVSSPDGVMRFNADGELMEIFAKVEPGGLRDPQGLLYAE